MTRRAWPFSTSASMATSPAGVSRTNLVTGSLTATIPVSISTVATQMVLLPDMGGYSTCSMMMKAAAAVGPVGGNTRLQLAAGYPRGSRSIRRRRSS